MTAGTLTLVVDVDAVGSEGEDEAGVVVDEAKDVGVL